MKKIKMILSILLSLILVLSFAGLSVSAGSSVLTQNTVIRPGNTYYINTFDDLKTLSILINERSQDCAGATFELTADITLNKGLLSLENGVPMYGGAEISDENAPALFRSMEIFKGTFDGKGHTIGGIYSKSNGIFAQAENAVIKNIKIVNSLIVSDEDLVGAFCGRASGSVFSNGIFSGIVINENSDAHNTSTGGIVGQAAGSELKYCKNDGIVSGVMTIGGIVGSTDTNTDFYGLCNAGTVTASEDGAGGIAGVLNLGETVSMKYCCNTGTVSAGIYAGGLAGYLDVEGDEHRSEISELTYMQAIIDDYYASGIHTDEWPPSGLVGVIDFDRYSELVSIVYDNAYNIRNCYAAGTVISQTEGKYGSICGGFDGCEWNFVNCWVNDSRFDGSDSIYHRWQSLFRWHHDPLSDKIIQKRIMTLGVDYYSDDGMKTEQFLSKLNFEEVKFILDIANENNGYPLLEEFHDESIHVHNYVYAVTKEMTCLENGIITYTCSCGDSYTEEIPAPGRHIAKFVRITKEPTCTEEGSSIYVCENCGEVFVLPIQVKSHYYTCKVLKRYDCQTGGSEQYTCERCGDSYIKDYPPEGHEYPSFRYKHLPSATTNGIMRAYCEGCDHYLVKETEPIAEELYEPRVFTESFIDAVRAGDYIYYPVKIFQKCDLAAYAKEQFKSDDLHAELYLQFYLDEDMLNNISVCPSEKLKNKGALFEIDHKTDRITVRITLNSIDDFTDDLLLFSFKYYCPDIDSLVVYKPRDNNIYYHAYSLRAPLMVKSDCYVTDGREYVSYVTNNYSGSISTVTKEGALEYLFSGRYTEDDIRDTIIKSSIESVDYEPSDSALNDYTFKVNGKASKIAFRFKNDSTATYTRDMAVIKSFDADGNEVPADSKNIAYEMWTIHRSFPVNEPIKVRAKYGKVWEDEYKHFTVYLKYQELPFVESVNYIPSFSAENDYVLKVNCVADKVQFINPNGTTATYTKSTAKSVVSYDKSGNEVPINSKDTAYEIWTIRRTMKTGCEMLVHVKTGGIWESEKKAFIIELRKKDVSSIESVTWNGNAVSKNDYYIKVSGQPSKIAFYYTNNSTATYTRSMANIKCYDVNNNEVSSDSKDVSYEVWMINRSMNLNVEMRARAKYGSVWEAEMFSFTVK